LKDNTHATGVDDTRQQLAAQLGVLVARINTTPSDVGPVTEAFTRVLDIAACAPGGQQALIDGLAKCAQVSEVLAFCKMFVNVIAMDCGGARHHAGAAWIQPVHDEAVAA
jgi:hypothetical protein